MKKLLALLLFTIPVFGQATVTYPGETAAAVTISSPSLAAMNSVIVSVIEGSPVLLVGSIGSTDTTLILSGNSYAGGITGLLIDSEVLTIGSISVGTTNLTLTVTRGAAGTTPASHVSGVTVRTLLYGSYAQLLKACLLSGFGTVMRPLPLTPPQ